MGHIIDSSGLRPDLVNIEAIFKMAPPTDVSGVRSFLGAINYYGKFVPSMRTLRYPLDNLLHADTKFEWSSECQNAFDRFKQLLSSDLLLTHYDPKKEIIVSAVLGPQLATNFLMALSKWSSMHRERSRRRRKITVSPTARDLPLFLP